MENLTKKVATKKATNGTKKSAPKSKVNEIVQAILAPVQTELKSAELLVTNNGAPKVGTYANNVIGINALGRKNTTSLSYWINDICALLNTENSDSIKVSVDFDGCKVIEFSELKTGKDKVEFTQNYVIKIDAIQEKLIKTIRRNSELYKVFQALVRTTKKGNYNRFFTLQALQKNTTFLQNSLVEILNK
jgi:hypothetical protein